MKSLLLYGVLGGLAYWLYQQNAAVIPPPSSAMGKPGQVPTGDFAPPNVYDLNAFPMGSFAIKTER